MEKVGITIQYLDDSISRLCYVNGKSDWIDLRSAFDVSLKKGESTLLHLGVAMKLPQGYEAIICPRSSAYKNFGIIQTNHLGVIDESYCGSNDWWKLPILAMRDTFIGKNERVCQFRIIKHQPQLIFEEGELVGADRGGFGSTGTK